MGRPAGTPKRSVPTYKSHAAVSAGGARDWRGARPGGPRPIPLSSLMPRAGILAAEVREHRSRVGDSLAAGRATICLAATWFVGMSGKGEHPFGPPRRAELMLSHAIRPASPGPRDAEALRHMIREVPHCPALEDRSASTARPRGCSRSPSSRVPGRTGRSRSVRPRRRRPRGCAAPPSRRASALTAPSAAASSSTPRGAGSSTSRATPGARSTRGRSARRGRTPSCWRVNPHRVTQVLYRAPYSDQWETRSLDWAMDRIARAGQGGPRCRLHRARRRGPAAQLGPQHRDAGRRDARRRGELPDQEAVLRRPGGRVDREPGADMTLRLGARSGRLVRPRRGHQLPAGPGQQRLHPVHGLEHGRGAPRRLPLAHEGQGAGRDADPRRPAVLAHLGALRPLRRHPGRQRHRLPGRPDQLRPRRTSAGSRSTSWPTPTPRPSSRKASGTPRTSTASSAASTRRPQTYDAEEGHWGYEGSRSDRRGDGQATDVRSDTRAPGSRRGAARGPRLCAHGRGDPARLAARGDDGCIARASRGATRPCSTRAASCRSSGGTSPATRRRWWPRSAAARAEQFVRVAELLCANSGRDRTTAHRLRRGLDPAHDRRADDPSRGHPAAPARATSAGPAAASWRCAAIPASRARPTSRPSTTCCPATCPSRPPTTAHETLDYYVEHEGLPTGYWANFRKFIVSLLKAWYGDAATAGERLPLRLAAAHRRRLLATADLRPHGPGRDEGLFPLRPEPGRRRAQRRPAPRRPAQPRLAGGARLVRDRERRPSGRTTRTRRRRRRSRPRSSSSPRRPTPRRTARLTNTQRLLQWHNKALDPPGDCRSDAWFVYNLGKRLKRLYAGSTDPKDQPLLNLTWDYDHDEPPRLPDGTLSRIEDEPDVEKVLRRSTAASSTRSTRGPAGRGCCRDSRS